MGERFTTTTASDVGTNAPLTLSADVAGGQVLFTLAGNVQPVGNIGGHLVIGVVLAKATARSLGKFLATMDA